MRTGPSDRTKAVSSAFSGKIGAISAGFSDKTRGLYIHIPFCQRKCRYCDFVSYSGMETEADSYIEAVIRELSEYEGSRIDTIFIGGGTPTVLNAAQLRMLCGAVWDLFDIEPGYEFSVETNPGTIDYDKAALLAQCGVNRISIGVQSFNDAELKILGRIHDAKCAYNTVYDVKRAGIDNISIDLMTALPGQNIAAVTETLKTAAQLPLKHISAYSLIIEDTTPMAEDCAAGRLVLPDEDEDREIYAFVSSFLKKHGFNRYEISNFAKDGFECRHNIRYWECKEYLGAGAAAHSYVDGVRHSNTPFLKEYMAGNRPSSEALDRADMIFEFIIMGMRMDRGISETEFKRRFNVSIRKLYAGLLFKLEDGGFIETSDGFIRFTDKGRDVSNSVLCEFAPV